MIQLALAFFGLTALFLATGTSANGRRWASVVGLCGQPFWLWFAYSASAWGLLALSVAYSAVYARGIWIQFSGQSQVKTWIGRILAASKRKVNQ